MKVLMTEYLRIDLDNENWECRVCDHVIGSARGNYKEGLLVYNRDPADIHPAVLDPDNIVLLSVQTKIGLTYMSSIVRAVVLKWKLSTHCRGMSLFTIWKWM